MDLRSCYFVADGLTSSSPCTDTLSCSGCNGNGSYDNDAEILVKWRAFHDAHPDSTPLEIPHADQ